LQHGCIHYHANCALVAPCCNAVVPCRLCHDEGIAEAPVATVKQSEQAQQPCTRVFDRYAVREMVCRLCGAQGPVGPSCSTCHASMARYYCSVCHLFEDRPGESSPDLTLLLVSTSLLLVSRQTVPVFASCCSSAICADASASVCANRHLRSSSACVQARTSITARSATCAAAARALGATPSTA
jgi:CHY zinc finger